MKKGAGGNFQLTWLFNENYQILGYSATIGYGVTKILQEGKPFQINIFLVKNTKCKAIQPRCDMELQRFYKKVKLFKLTFFSA